MKVLRFFGVFFITVLGLYADSIPPWADYEIVGEAIGYGDDTPIGNSLCSEVHNTSPKTLPGPLSDIEISFTDGNGGHLIYHFDKEVIAQLPKTLSEEGLYISLNIYKSTTPYPAKIIKMNITNKAGTIFAENAFLAPQNVSEYPEMSDDIEQGAYFWNVTTATYTFKDINGNSAIILNVPLSEHKRVWFQGSSIAERSSLEIIEPIVIPGSQFETDVMPPAKSGLAIKLMFQNGMWSTIAIDKESLKKINEHLRMNKYIQIRSICSQVATGEGMSVLLEGYQGSNQVFSQQIPTVLTNKSSIHNGAVIPYKDNQQTYIGMSYVTDAIKTKKPQNIGGGRSGNILNIVLAGKNSDNTNTIVAMVPGSTINSLRVNPSFLNGMRSSISLSKSSIRKVNQALRQENYITLQCTIEVGNGTGFRIRTTGYQGAYQVFSEETPDNIIDKRSFQQIPLTGQQIIKLGISYITDFEKQGTSEGQAGNRLSIVLAGDNKNKEVQKLMAAGETIEQLHVGFCFGDECVVIPVANDTVPADFLDQMNHKLAQEHGVSISADIDSAGSYHQATIAAHSDGATIFSVPKIELLSEQLDCQPVPTSSSLTGGFVEYKTSNMHIPMRVNTLQHSFVFNENASVLRDHKITMSQMLLSLTKEQRDSAHDIAQAIKIYLEKHKIPVTIYTWTNTIEPSLLVANLSKFSSSVKVALDILATPQKVIKAKSKRYMSIKHRRRCRY